MPVQVKSIVVIGPVHVGKSTVCKSLSERTGLPVVAMDDVRSGYYEEVGFDGELAERLRREQGAGSLWSYVKAFDAHSVERILADFPDYIIDMGGGSTVHEQDDQQERVRRALAPFRNVVLLLPCENPEESLDFLNKRTGWSSEGRNINRLLLTHLANTELATLTVYVANRSSEEIADEILRRIAEIA